MNIRITLRHVKLMIVKAVRCYSCRARVTRGRGQSAGEHIRTADAT